MDYLIKRGADGLFYQYPVEEPEEPEEKVLKGRILQEPSEKQIKRGKK